VKSTDYKAPRYVVFFTPITSSLTVPKDQSKSRPFEMFFNTVHFYDEKFLAPNPTPSRRTTICRLSTTAYSIYLQLPSISGGCSSIHSHAVV